MRFNCNTCDVIIDSTIHSYYVTMEGVKEKNRFCTEECLSRFDFKSYVVRGGIVPAGALSLDIITLKSKDQ